MRLYFVFTFVGGPYWVMFDISENNHITPMRHGQNCEIQEG